ncbi:hypothetical protein P692DRAFT_20607034 [Suillus brevipes Sb2]|nr:hypothetical protein P692DRAFT_20607034 [Suillus brevipes Sb2]
MAERARARSLPRLMILTGRIRAPASRLRPLLLMIMCFGTLRLFVLGAQFDSARTSRLLFHPPRTSSCCVFLHLRSDSPPNSPADADRKLSITGLLLIFHILYVPLTLITGLPSVGRSGNPLRRND